MKKLLLAAILMSCKPDAAATQKRIFDECTASGGEVWQACDTTYDVQTFWDQSGHQTFIRTPRKSCTYECVPADDPRRQKPTTAEKPQ